MDFDRNNRILLLGAGFSKNFGVPLASEMWYLIFNHKKIQAQPKIKELMLNNFDFELVYDSILEGFKDKEGLLDKRYSFIKFTQDEKDAIKEAINFAYEYIDEIYIQYLRYLRKTRHEKTQQQITLKHVSQFISLFIPDGYILATSDGHILVTADGYRLKTTEQNFIFTLNQDLFFERAYSKDICIPGIESSQKSFGNRINEKLKSSDLVELPQEDELHNKDIFKGELLLIKLHGSYNWVGVDGERAIIIGRNKESKIKKVTLLSYYFEKFKEVLSSDQRNLVIIGYSFYHDHINRVISNLTMSH